MVVGSESAEFRSNVQQRGMQLVAEGICDALICDRTGEGKSAIVLGPSLFETGVTVYVSPLKSLLQDIYGRCQALQLSVVFLADVLGRSQQCPRRVVLLVSPEQVGYDDYRHIVGILWATRNLCRIVVDEVHILVLGEHYRQCMTRMRTVRPEGVGAQIVLMTATSPPSMTGRILAAVGCELQKVVILRGNLRRDNIGIVVRHLEIGDRFALCHYAFEEVIQGIFARKRTGGKCLMAALT